MCLSRYCGFLLTVLSINWKEFSFRINLSISRTETRNVQFFHLCLFNKIYKVGSIFKDCGFCDYDIGCSNVALSTKEEVLSVRTSDESVSLFTLCMICYVL